MTELERRIIGELQYDLPIAAKPYAIVASRLNISESILMTQIKSMLVRGIIRKMGAVLQHRRVGIKANALCVWQVPEARVATVGEMFAALPEVTHCYERQVHADWPYNLYTMVHALTKEVCEAHIDAMRNMSGIDTFKIFYSIRELKKTSMRYFE
jgi:DNA-binding Lrp family transcriptional regulator